MQWVNSLTFLCINSRIKTCLKFHTIFWQNVNKWKKRNFKNLTRSSCVWPLLKKQVSIREFSFKMASATLTSTPASIRISSEIQTRDLSSSRVTKTHCAILTGQERTANAPAGIKRAETANIDCFSLAFCAFRYKCTLYIYMYKVYI